MRSLVYRSDELYIHHTIVAVYTQSMTVFHVQLNHCQFVCLFAYNRSESEVYPNNGVDYRRLVLNVLHI